MEENRTPESVPDDESLPEVREYKCKDCGAKAPEGWTYCETHAAVHRKEYAAAIKKADLQQQQRRETEE